jgi:signal transduction histidine kinase
VLRVSDDGRGFDYGRTTGANGHYGLATMRERAEELGGHLSVMTKPGRGSTVIAVVPTRLVAREDLLAEL